MKYHIFLGLLAVASAYPGIVHDEAPQLEEKYDHALIGESGHHHHIQHEHAKSHQSIKFEHFHPVPVYVKKEHKHLLEHPLEKGKSEQNLKLIHPESEHKHGGGLVLEDHRFDTEHLAASLSHGGLEHGGLEHGGLEHGGFEHGGFEHGGFEQGGFEHGGAELGGLQHYGGGFEGYEGGEGLKAYAELQSAQGYGTEEGKALAGNSEGGYHY